jgi:hypothetical protein
MTAAGHKMHTTNTPSKELRNPSIPISPFDTACGELGSVVAGST